MNPKIKWVYLAGLLVAGVLLAGRAGAQCLGQTKGKVTIQINHCRTIEPKLHFSNKDAVPLGFYDMYETKTIVNAFRTYRGSLVVGDVQKSRAVDPVLNDNNALLGQTVTVFLNDVDEEFCNNLDSTRIWTGELEQVCCDDSLNAPCLLDTSYTFSNLNRGSNHQVFHNKSDADSPDALAASEALSDEIKKARYYFKKQDLKQSIKYFELAQKKNSDLQMIDHYVLGLSYFHLDQSYEQSIFHLEKVHQFTLSKSGVELEPFMKRSLLLLARVYAVTRNQDRSVLILNEMISESDHFKDQIQSALYHEDFGWINSSRQYQEFVRSALRVN